MRLCEHPEFEQAILAASEHFKDRGLRPAFIEKDYFVTEALRIVAQTLEQEAIFKGGTSLSKGWNLIQRFSEDLDIFVDPQAFDPPLGSERAVNRALKSLRNAVDAHPGLSFMKDASKTHSGFARSDRFSFNQRFGGPDEVAGQVLVESGIASGREPTVVVELRSYLGQFLNEHGTSLGAADESGFAMRLLHFRRTFVEKMFAIHSKVELFKRHGREIGSYARHYYDLYQLGGQAEVTEMLRSNEYGEIKTDYDEVSRRYFPESYFAPNGMSFSQCDALFPPAELDAILSVEYQKQCKQLCLGTYPSWKDVMGRFEELRPLL